MAHEFDQPVRATVLASGDPWRARARCNAQPLTPTSLHVRCAARKQPAVERRDRMTWAQRLKRVFNLVTKTCPPRSDAVRLIARIAEPEVIKEILSHLDVKGAAAEASRLPACSAARGGGSAGRKAPILPKPDQTALSPRGLLEMRQVAEILRICCLRPFDGAYDTGSARGNTSASMVSRSSCRTSLPVTR